MPRKPNYQFDRLERNRKKAAKKAAKLKAKRNAKDDPEEVMGKSSDWSIFNQKDVDTKADQQREAGVVGLSSHGLRKASAVRLAKASCTSHAIKDITGHDCLKEVQLYTKVIGQKKLAKRAAKRLGNLAKYDEIIYCLTFP